MQDKSNFILIDLISNINENIHNKTFFRYSYKVLLLFIVGKLLIIIFINIRNDYFCSKASNNTNYILINGYNSIFLHY